MIVKGSNFRTLLKKKIDDIYFENMNEAETECSVCGYCGPLRTLVNMEDSNNRFYSEDGRIVLRYVHGFFIPKQNLGSIEFALLLVWVVVALALFYYVNFAILG